MKKIIIVAAGRKNNLEILFTYLEAYKNEFDLCKIWVNTDTKEDLNCIYALNDKYTWVELVELDSSTDFNVFENMRQRLTLFYEYCSDVDSLYLRLDDDICFIEKNAISKMFQARELDTKSPLVIGNIVNNAVISSIYQAEGVIYWPEKLTYNCLDSISWSTPSFAENLHKQFIKKVRENKVSDMYIKSQHVDNYSRVSINAVSFRGDMGSVIKTDIQKIISYMGIKDEEEFLTVVLPKQLNASNYILGDAVFSHYSFFIQKEHLDASGTLTEYKKLAKNIYDAR